MPDLRIYNIKVNQSDFATQVWDVDLEIKHTHNFVAK